MKERPYWFIDGKKIYPPKHPHDSDVCPKCPNNGTCLSACLPIQWIDGHISRKEPLLKNQTQQLPRSDYNSVLAELIEDKANRDQERLEEIRSVEQPRRRLIMAGILAGLTQKQIAQQAHISQGRISRIYQGLTSR